MSASDQPIGVPQGRCETTLTERFSNPQCSCDTYPGNLGPCRTFEQGASGRCVYCEHSRICHFELGEALHVAAIKALRDALAAHHEWHMGLGVIGIAKDGGRWIDLDMSVEYGDSRLCDRTLDALRNLPFDLLLSTDRWDEIRQAFEKRGTWPAEIEPRRVDEATVLAPVRPSETQWGGLARDIMMWLDMGPGSAKTPRALFAHLEQVGRPAPQWLRDEPEMQNLDHVPSKGTRCAIIYKAMLFAGTDAGTQP